MSASFRVLDKFAKSNGSEAIRILSASGQLGYGVPTSAFNAGLERAPHLVGCDMGSIDLGPYYLGSGELATAPAATRRDLRKVLLGALKLTIPLVIGSAGSAGARPHLEQTLAMVREIAREEDLHFRLGILRADVEKPVLKAAVDSGGVVSIDDMPPLDAQEVDASSNIVGQMGMSAFQRALAAGVDVIIAGRACDTAIFAALPAMAGFPVGPAQHMAKIIECASLCCVPGADAMPSWQRSTTTAFCSRVWRHSAAPRPSPSPPALDEINAPSPPPMEIKPAIATGMMCGRLILTSL